MLEMLGMQVKLSIFKIDMYFIYDKKTTEVKMYSEGKNEFNNPDFAEIEIMPTDEEKQKLTDNWKSFIKNGKLFFEKNDWILKEEKKQAIEKVKQDIQQTSDFLTLKNKIASLIDLLQ